MIRVAVFGVHMFRYRDLFLFHFVRKYRFERDVADVLDFEVKAFEVWLATDGDEHNIGLGPMESRNARVESHAPLLLSVLRSLRRRKSSILLCREGPCAMPVLNLNLRPCLVNNFWNCSLS